MKTTDKNYVNTFSQQVEKKEQLKLKALREKKQTVWFGLGMFGIVGWSVAVPTLLGAALGIWIDKKYPQSFSWTLTFLILGLLTGCLISWHWIANEHNEINKNNEDDDE